LFFGSQSPFDFGMPGSFQTSLLTLPYGIPDFNFMVSPGLPDILTLQAFCDLIAKAALRRRRSRSGTTQLLPAPLRRPLAFSLALPVTSVQAARELRNLGPRPVLWLRHVLFDFDCHRWVIQCLFK